MPRTPRLLCFAPRLMCFAAVWTLAMAAAAGSLGCSNKLETGYEPQRLGATPAQRRSYYAPPFSPEARAAPDKDDALEARRPRPGY